MHVDLETVQVGHVLLGCDAELGDVELARVGAESVPLAVALDRLREDARRDVRVHIDDRHVFSSQSLGVSECDGEGEALPGLALPPLLTQYRNWTRAVISFCVTEATRSEAAFMVGCAK